VYPPLDIQVFVNKDTICPGEPVMVSTSVTGGDGGPYIISLDDGTIVNPPFIIYPEENTGLIINAKDGCNYSATDQVPIYVLQLPPNSFDSDRMKGCQPFTVQFNEHSPDIGQSFLWNFGDYNNNNISFVRNPVHTFNDDGVYDVMLTVTSVEGCTNAFVMPQMITVYPKPDSRFIADPEIAGIVEPIIQFDNLSTLMDHCYWTFGDGDSSSAYDPLHRYNAIGTYPVQLIVTSEHGCLDTSTFDVAIHDELTFYAPTVFSPDNDGINDIFCVFGTGIDPARFHLYVFDRWGEVIWETTKFDSANPFPYGWNGSVKGGKKAKIGTYTWLCVFFDTTQNEHQEAGAVNLIK
jgi:gliding motility-associated-like protein